MVQVKSYQGYFKNGQFMSPQAVKLPENVEVFITITGRMIPQDVIWARPDNSYETKLLPEHQAAIKFLDAIEKINEKEIDSETLDAFERWDNGEFRLDFEERLL